jgi:hypothetical protein
MRGILWIKSRFNKNIYIHRFTSMYETAGKDHDEPLF